MESFSIELVHIDQQEPFIAQSCFGSIYLCWRDQAAFAIMVLFIEAYTDSSNQRKVHIGLYNDPIIRYVSLEMKIEVKEHTVCLCVPRSLGQ